jgi:DNA-binding transcriptional regulator YiaG
MVAKMISLDEVRNRALSKPEVLKEYEALRTEFKIAKMAISMRKAAKLTQQEFADKVGIKQYLLLQIMLLISEYLFLLLLSSKELYCL